MARPSLRVTHVVVVVATVSVLAACNGTSSDPVKNSSPPSSISVPPAPTEISDPLRLDSYRARPCSVLSPRQVDGLGFDRARDHTYPKDPVPSCGLEKDGDLYHTSVVLQLDGTTASMWREEGGRPSTARSTSVRGYPAVIHPAERDADFDDTTDSVGCALSVEVSDTQGFAVGALEMPPESDPCLKMMEIAELVIANVKGDR
ncbi:MAG: DUF3558 domain-containing protein [Thermocrispum sp.]